MHCIFYRLSPQALGELVVRRTHCSPLSAGNNFQAIRDELSRLANYRVVTLHPLKTFMHP